MDKDEFQPWVFFWASSPPDTDSILANKSQLKRKAAIRRFLLVSQLLDVEEGPLQAG